MPPFLLPIDTNALIRFGSVVEVCDPGEIDNRSLVSQRPLPELRICRYLLLDRTIPHIRFHEPITIMAKR